MNSTFNIKLRHFQYNFIFPFFYQTNYIISILFQTVTLLNVTHVNVYSPESHGRLQRAGLFYVTQKTGSVTLFKILIIIIKL